MNRRTLLVAGIALLLAGGVAAAWMLRNRRDITTSSDSAYREYLEGVDARDRYYFREARVHFAAALKKDPEFVMAMLQLGDLSADPDQRRALVAAASRFANRLTPREALFLRLETAKIANDQQAIRAAAEELKKRYPKDPTGTMVLANQAVAAGRPDEAIRLYKGLLAEAPNNAPAYNQLGYIYANRGDFADAIANLRRYAFLAPDQPNPFDSLGEVETYFGRYDDAIRDLDKALTLRPDFYQSYGNLAECYRQKGDLRRARENAEKALAMADVSDRNGYVEQILLIDLHLGDFADARRVVEAMPEKGVPFAGVLRGLFESVIEARQGRVDDALLRVDALEKRALAEASRYKAGQNEVEDGVAMIRGGILYAAGRFSDAVAPLEKAVSVSGGSGLAVQQRLMRARAWLAVCLAHQKNFSRADELLARNRSFNPNDADTLRAADRVAALRRATLSATR
jgi:tetratricopeptide (TPR) repeat protein